MNRKVKRCIDCQKIYAVCVCRQDKEAKKGRMMQAAMDRGFSDGMRQRGGKRNETPETGYATTGWVE